MRERAACDPFSASQALDRARIGKRARPAACGPGYHWRPSAGDGIVDSVNASTAAVAPRNFHLLPAAASPQETSPLPRRQQHAPSVVIFTTMADKAPVPILAMGCASAACDFKVLKLQRRPPGPDDVVFDMKYCGLCLSDGARFPVRLSLPPPQHSRARQHPPLRTSPRAADAPPPRCRSAHRARRARGRRWRGQVPDRPWCATHRQPPRGVH